MGIFNNPSKIMKLMPFILIIDGTSKQHKIMAQKDFYQSLKGLSWFKAYRKREKIRWAKLSRIQPI